MDNKNNPLIADSSATTLQRVSEALAVFKETISHSSTQEDIDNLQIVLDALKQAIEGYPPETESDEENHPLISDMTADTLSAVRLVISAIHLSFCALNDSTLLQDNLRRAFGGFVFILDGVEEALEFEITRNSGAFEAEGEGNQ